MKNINYSKIFDKLFPINRSLLGDEYRKSLGILKNFIKIRELKYKSGKKIFDWIIPNEWKIKEGYIKYKNKIIIDYKNCNLHVASYSDKINKKLPLEKLQNNLYSLPKYPRFVPYVTSYYEKNWGFCMSHKQRKSLKRGSYHCYINSEFKKGYLVNGFAELKGKSKKINLITTYLCHPSLANDNLSGPLVMIGLYNKIKNWKKRNFSYQFLINPETIGSLCFLHSHGKKIKKHLNAGLVLTGLGGPKKKLSYKLSKNGNSSLDEIFKYLNEKKRVSLMPFDPAIGSDERQFNSPGFNFPVGKVFRSNARSYTGLHNSNDNKKLMNIEMIKKSVNEIEKILKLHDHLLPIKRYMPYGELMLGKRNLITNIGYSGIANAEKRSILFNILSYADGYKNILEIAKLKRFDINKAIDVLNICVKHKLIKFI